MKSSDEFTNVSSVSSFRMCGTAVPKLSNCFDSLAEWTGKGFVLESHTGFGVQISHFCLNPFWLKCSRGQWYQRRRALSGSHVVFSLGPRR